MLTVIFALKEARLPSLGPRLLDLEKVSVNEIPYVVPIEGGAMIVDRLLKEIGHLAPILRELRSDLLKTREISHDRYVIHRYHATEQSEALLYESHESLESLVPVPEADAHYDRAYNVADRHTERRRHVGRCTASQGQTAH